MENEYGNDRGGASYRSPGSSSVISDGSSIFDDGVSPLDRTTTTTAAAASIPRISLQGATPVRPSGFVPPAALKPLIGPLTPNIQDQSSSSLIGAGGILSPFSGQSSAAYSSKDTSVSSASSSRFHIIKIDTGPYKRGRWNCRDYDESSSSAIRSDMIAVGGPRSGSSNGSSGKGSLYEVENKSSAIVDGLQTSAVAEYQQKAAILATPLESRQQTTPNGAVTDLSLHQQSITVNPNSTTNNVQQRLSQSPNSSNAPPQLVRMVTNDFRSSTTGVDFNNAAAAILDSIILDSMQQQNDRLSVSSGRVGDASVLVANLKSESSGMVHNMGPHSAGSSMAAIDNKIEQAMDLVKTHLLYAVREEVEVLKEKIIDLEKKVFRLETENKLLREYAPPEILQQIQQGGNVGQTGSTAFNLPVGQSQQSLSSPLQPQMITTSPAIGIPTNDSNSTTTNPGNVSPSSQQQQNQSTSS